MNKELFDLTDGIWRIETEDFEEAIKLRNTEKELSENLESETPEVTKETVYSAISKISGVPEDNIGKSDLSKLRGMKSILESSVFVNQRLFKLFSDLFN